MRKRRTAVTALCLAMALSVSGMTAMAGDPDAAGEVSEEEKTDCADSWRYSNGDPVESSPAAALSAATLAAYTTWPETSGAEAYGVDVSKWQGGIDWAAAKADGVEFAIIRCGYGQDYTSQDDPYWEANADACTELGIPFGAYLYSYADSVHKAVSEAEHALRLVEGYGLSYPIYYDMENSTLSGLSASELAEIADAFCSTVEDAGYETGVYASLSWFN